MNESAGVSESVSIDEIRRHLMLGYRRFSVPPDALDAVRAKLRAAGAQIIAESIIGKSGTWRLISVCFGPTMHTTPAVATHDADEDRITMDLYDPEAVDESCQRMADLICATLPVPGECGCGSPVCTGPTHHEHQCGGPSEACMVPGCAECGS